MNPKVDDFLAKSKKWQTEMQQLRMIVLDCGLKEELKWRVPCYTYKDSNVLIIGGFKECCVLSFIKGILLKDDSQILVAPGENSQSVRIAKFTNGKDIDKLAPILKTYIYEAIEIEKLGLTVELKEKDNLDFPEELINKMEENAKFKRAFEAMTSGRQRGYNMHFSSAKQAATRIARIEKYTDRIMNGKGINDCVCGLSKRMPNCDGSHKQLELK